jgi:uncharacterized membrane protein
MWFLSLAALGAAVYLLYRNSEKQSAQRWISEVKDPLQIAKVRYASGEITREEYEVIKNELEEKAPV